MVKNRIYFVFFIILFIFINSQESENNKSNKEGRVINYYYKDGKIYSIEENEKYYKIIVEEQIACFTEPCIPPKLDEKLIENEEDCQILQNLFEEVFQNLNIKERSYLELSSAQKRKILKIFNDYETLSILEYEIIKNSNANKKYKERGYTCDFQDNDSVLCTIAMGEKPTDGYSIGIKKIKIKEYDATIYITEKVPGKDSFEDDVLTYPIVQVKFNHMPSSLEVTNYETGSIFKKLNEFYFIDN